MRRIRDPQQIRLFAPFQGVLSVMARKRIAHGCQGLVRAVVLKTLPVSTLAEHFSMAGLADFFDWNALEAADAYMMRTDVQFAAESSSNAPGATDTPLHLLGQPAASDQDLLATPSDCQERPSPAATLTTAKVASSPSARDLPLSPRIKRREIVATLGNAHEFGRFLVARTWELGMFQSHRKGFVGDGGNWLWTLSEKAFQPFGFIGILDIIHGVTHVFAAAMAGRERAAGGAIYCD